MTSPFLSIEPCKALQKYVACYYFLNSDAPGFTSKHYSFPHTYNSLSIYKDSSFESRPLHFTVMESDKPNYCLFVQKKQQSPVMVELSGKINRATILFKDFGINHFVNEPLSDIMRYDYNRFDAWNEDPLFAAFAENLFSTNDIVFKKETLDKFLLQRLYAVDLTYLETAVALLCDFEQYRSIDEIAKQLLVPIRTFNRHFKETLGVSPVEYRRIAQFRRSLNDRLFVNKFESLTAIGYNSNFYDQSYFIKIYKKLTGSNPTRFFNMVDKSADNQLIFQFVRH